MEICFATNNDNKLQEIRELLPDFHILSLKDIGHSGDLPEDQNTLEGNSHQKAEYVFKNYNVDCFSDDTGLEVFALDGEPGVYSARYAGVHHDSEANMRLLLDKMADIGDRSAQFRTVITLILDGKVKQFEGVVKGTILKSKAGEKGFGYDPIFQPKGFDSSFAEMSSEEKNKISHRGEAVKKLVQYLNHLSK
ncbi:non-canonical purine NTP diphosphatase [Fulvivirga sp. RKSG066]|uniref:non-canonical purine NTP diphosphatase n=1 Tax=Fulvivirga aurantia TaxID=2529383 RepID=UPI0012BD0BA1|nr:non-canonical purine NTP diphosphatase [Fulvivirga aurantia]MTI22041.1 non-canonical purine NTP diphosphatase [Fulvivirga aurantia]